VLELEQFHPHLREKRTPESTITFGSSVEQLQLGTVVKASQALSSEIVLCNLLEIRMRVAVAVEHASANRGLLIHFVNGGPRIDAEATTGLGRIDVTLGHAAVTPSELPESVLHYASVTSFNLARIQDHRRGRTREATEATVNFSTGYVVDSDCENSPSRSSPSWAPRNSFDLSHCSE
jgi:hypothetical protein